PFYTTDPTFRETVSNIARESQTWVLVGSLGIRNASQTPQQATEVYNSGSLVSPNGEWVARYDKVHLVPFGEYVPFKRVFSFAGGLTKEVGDFARGTSRAPLDAGGTKLGVFICYESIFPDEVRQFAAFGAQVLVNISNDGWYGDSGAYAQHLKQARMRAVENSRWLLRDTNTGVTASIDPYGRIVASVPRKVRTVLDAPYALLNVTTFYMRQGDWFAYLCAIISVAGLLKRLEEGLSTEAELIRRSDDISAYFELAREGEVVDGDLRREIDSLRELVDRLETETLLSGENDARNAIVTIHPGAGGTESQDWA